jgi:hypothetical protein
MHKSALFRSSTLPFEILARTLLIITEKDEILLKVALTTLTLTLQKKTWLIFKPNTFQKLQKLSTGTNHITYTLDNHIFLRN